MCTCCSPETQLARTSLGLVECLNHASNDRVVGVRGFSHKADSDLIIGSHQTISELTRNDRRRDRRFKLK